MRLRLKNISKSYGLFKANSAISLDIAAGEIHALLGENGAGKSTLVKIIYGLLQPQEGEMWYEEQKVVFKSPQEARKLGIAMVFQHFSLFEELSVYENIRLGLPEEGEQSLRLRIQKLLSTYQLSLNLEAQVHTLSVGEKQRIEIIRALLQNPKLLIMDEPTSVLTPQEVEKLFETLKTLAQQGCSILYISHKLHEIQMLCHSATILRQGKVVGSLNPRTASTKDMAHMMLGSDILALHATQKPHQEVLLFTQDFTLHKGQILGVAGIAGNGQEALLEALSGEQPSSLTLTFKNEEITHFSLLERRNKGLICVPEERNGHASVGELSLEENSLLCARDILKLSSKGLIDEAKAQVFTKDIIARFDVRTKNEKSLARSLSGGNLQKYIIGRAILQQPEALIISQPTWGVDAGAAQAIHQALIDLSLKGTGIMLISQDLDELLDICDSLCVISNGKLSPVKPIKDYTREEIGTLMGAQHA